jgi:hypothetical protein
MSYILITCDEDNLIHEINNLTYSSAEKLSSQTFKKNAKLKYAAYSVYPMLSKLYEAIEINGKYAGELSYDEILIYLKHASK